MSSTLNVIAGHWFDWQIAMLWQTAVLIGIVWIVDVAIRTWAHPQVRYALWMLVLVKLLIPPTWTSPASVTSHLPDAVIRAAQSGRSILALEANENRAAIPIASGERAETQIPLSPSISGSGSEKNVFQDAQRGQDARVPLEPATVTERTAVPPASSRQVDNIIKPPLH